MESIMATIFTRKTDLGTLRYYGDLSVEGKRYRRYLGLSKKTAQQALKKLEYELRFNSLIDETEHVSYMEAIRRFSIHIELTGITYEQVKYISSRILAFQQYCTNNGAITLQDVRQDACRAYMTIRSKDRIMNFYSLDSEKKWKYPATSTLNREIGFQKRFFRFCLSNDWIQKNPWSSVTPIIDKDGKNPRYSFTKDDLKMIFKNAGKFHDFYYVLLHTGIRPTDAFSLQSSSFNGNSLTVQQKKTGDWLQCIPMPEHLLETLSVRIEKNDILFPELQCDRQRRNARTLIQSLFEPEFIRVKNINLHTFRHTYAHNMLNRGMPKEILQTFLGHRSIRTTEIYANWVSNDELARWVT
jgi:site-specific recombinase XerD